MGNIWQFYSLEMAKFLLLWFCEKNSVISTMYVPNLLISYSELTSRTIVLSSYYFDIKFVKATFLLKNLLKSWFHEKKIRR